MDARRASSQQEDPLKKGAGEGGEAGRREGVGGKEVAQAGGQLEHRQRSQQPGEVH